MRKLGKFERRLLAVMLLLSVGPTLLVAIFGARSVVHYLERVGSPVLKESARTSLELARALKVHFEQSASAAAFHLGELYDLERQPSQASMLDLMARITRSHHADFAALYTLEDSVWVRRITYPRETTRLDSTLAAASFSPTDTACKVSFSDPDVIGSAVALAPDSAVVTGFMLEQGTLEMMRRTGEDLSRYSSLPLYVRSQGLFLIAVISVIVAIMVLASFIVARIIARRISHPINELATATERVAQGDLDFKVDVEARDEIASLVDAFNKMTTDLKQYKADLVKAERLAAWRDVARRIAHEIRNPLTPLQTTIYRLKERFKDSSERDEILEMLETMSRKVEDLIAMANRFSEFAKMPEPKPEPLDLNKVVTQVLTLFDATLDGITVVKDLSTQLPQVFADATQIRRLIENLVKNAIEAMDKGGTLTIRTHPVTDDRSKVPAYVRLEVSDTGSGIPDEIRDKIFEPYHTTKPSGSGLGLAVVHRIVKDHGGRIDFETSSKGTTFKVDLPVVQAAEGKL